MPKATRKRLGLTERVARYRSKRAKAGAKRVEVTVPAKDSALIREVARVLRGDGAEAEKLRGSMAAFIAPAAETGADLVAFLRESPFVGVDAEIERDKSTGRPTEF